MFATKIRVNTKICAVLLVLSFLVPVGAHAQTSGQFQPQTREQIIAYLYGQITQLQILLAERLAEERSGSNSSSNSNSSNNNSNSSSRADVEVDTLSAQNITDDSVTFRGEIDLDRENEAYVWFEYVDENDRERQTTKRRVTDSRGDVQTFTASVNNLRNDEKYFFRAVAEDENGDIAYGSARSFTTDDDSFGGSNNNNNDSDNDDFELSVSNRSFSVGDTVEIEWELPANEVNSQNWVGIYKTGNDSRNFLTWKYVSSDDGTVSFTINEAGTYEARLFLRNTYNSETSSQTFTVSR